MVKNDDSSSLLPETCSTFRLSTVCCVTCSEEAVDVKAVVGSWLQRRSESERAVLEPWIEEFFYKALELYKGLVRVGKPFCIVVFEQ